MNQMARRYLFFVSKPYSFAILEPLQQYIHGEAGGRVMWFLASVARDYPAPGETLASTRQVRDFNPDAVLAPGNVVPPFWSGLKVQVFHGLDDEVKGFYHVKGLFDLYCTPGPAITTQFERLAARHRHFHVIETGWPKLDPLAFPANPQLMRRELGLDPSRPVILYAPTFPPKYTSAPDLRPVIGQLTQGSYHWLVKFHPLMDREVIELYRTLSGESFQVVDDLNILPYMQAADVLITDTSSVAYEFLMLDRPIITYRAIAREDKGLNIGQPEELVGAIRRCLEHPEEFATRRREYLSRLHPYSDGESSRRVVEAVETALRNNLRRRLRSKPLNLVRRLKIRRMVAP